MPASDLHHITPEQLENARALLQAVHASLSTTAGPVTINLINHDGDPHSLWDFFKDFGAVLATALLGWMTYRVGKQQKRHRRREQRH
ncbi:hypothetical protein E3E12_07420 [Formicincola oecophyllae]|uniref:Uncharacterized protein n=1 Tax=Formicincola oecophyllae TaxID=2558361 RepID=A0A4Y6UDC8_9PROT|nr:hypothetical protein [Formicincola oecophyllae]QDH14035.1 hypothetical protein E3E12_07420 [Formicincola oecophyllae]